MKNLELNKIASAILIAGIIAMVVGNLADILYKPDKEFPRGYQVEVTNAVATTADTTTQAVQLDIAQLMSKAQAELGLKESKKCAICHTFNKGGANRVGPNLWNIVNAKQAQVPGFTFSPALSAKTGTWNYKELVEYLMSPRKYAPGTKMTFAGFSNPQDAANMVAYLRTLSDNPAPLPK